MAIFKSEGKVKFIKKEDVRIEGKRPFAIFEFVDESTYDRISIIVDINKMSPERLAVGHLVLDTSEYRGRTVFNYVEFQEVK